MGSGPRGSRSRPDAEAATAAQGSVMSASRGAGPAVPALGALGVDLFAKWNTCKPTQHFTGRFSATVFGWDVVSCCKKELASVRFA